MTYPRYPAYKESGVPWLGPVPEHWDITRLRRIAAINPTKAEVAGLPVDTEVSFVPMEAVREGGGLSLDRVTTIEQAQSGYTFFRDKDVIVAKITPCFENGKLALAEGLTNGIAFGTTELHVLRARVGVLPKYLLYTALSERFQRLGESEMYGAGGQKRVPAEFVQNYALALPPLSEQRAIAAFLDRETAQIDALIARLEQLVALLQEKRQALISHAVTKGLDPSAPMKESGIEWLAEIPAHWDVVRLKSIADIRYGLGQPPPEVEDGIPLIRATNIDAGSITDKGMIYIKKDDVPPSRNAELKAGEIIVVRSGALTGDSAIVPPRYEGTIAGYDMVVTVTEGDSQFVAWSLLSSQVRDYQFMLQRMRAAQPHLNAEELGGTVLLRPPLDEQRAVVAQLRAALGSVEARVASCQRSITLLQERRAALITAAVTGQIDVRGKLW